MSFGSNRSNAIIGAAGTAMGAVANRREDSDDLFAHTRMSLGDHIEELRRHMIKALIGFFIAMNDVANRCAGCAALEFNALRLCFAAVLREYRGAATQEHHSGQCTGNYYQGSFFHKMALLFGVR